MGDVEDGGEGQAARLDPDSSQILPVSVYSILALAAHLLAIKPPSIVSSRRLQYTERTFQAAIYALD